MGYITKIAWRNVGRHGRRSALTAGSMAIGVGLSMAVVALSDGMYDQMFDTLIRQEMGHVQVHAPKYPKQHAIYETMDEGAVMGRLSGLEGAEGIAPRVYGFALLGAGDRSAGGRLSGVDPTREPKVTLVQDRIVEGRYLSRKPDHEVLLGKGLAETLRTGLGGEVVAVTQAADGSLGNDLYRVVGIFNTGSAALDRSGAFLHIEDAQSLLALDGRIHEVALLAADTDEIGALATRTKTALSGLGLLVQTWSQIDPTAAQLMATQDGSVWVLLVVVFAVAAFGVLNTMLMSVFERIRELGVMRALGLGPGQIVRLVVAESVFLTVAGGLVGVVLGLGLDWLLVRYGIDLTGFTKGFSMVGITYEPVLRGEIQPGRIVDVLVGLFVVALAASFWPALRAARLNPVQAMREQ